MTIVDRFAERTVRDLRRRLALLDDEADRRPVEDAIALLTDYRLSGLDEPAFERVLASLHTGRSPVWLATERPDLISDELERRWAAYRDAAIAVANVG